MRICALLTFMGTLVFSPCCHAFAEESESPGTGDRQKPQISFDTSRLPEKTRATLERIKAAARSGDIDELRAAMEWSELPPDIGLDAKINPIDHWKSISSDGTARDIMARMLDVLDRGFTKRYMGSDREIYIWPYLAEMPLDNLPPSAEVDLHRLAGPEDAEKMKKSGKYSGFHAVIGKDGTWHAFFKKK